MLASLVLPIIISGVVLFFLSFISWMILHLHKDDWRKLPGNSEDAFLNLLNSSNIPEASYMLPGVSQPSEANSPEFQKKVSENKAMLMTVMPKINMGKNLLFTMIYFLVVSFVIGYLTSIAYKPGESFLNVFRFVFTAAFAILFAAIVQHSIWFRNRILGHLMECVVYAAVTAAIFAAMWPKA
jgi:hypothetical protein